MLDENDTPTDFPGDSRRGVRRDTAGTGDTPGTAPGEAAAPEPAAGSDTGRVRAAAPRREEGGPQEHKKAEHEEGRGQEGRPRRARGRRR